MRQHYKEEATFIDCLLLHRLLITGGQEDAAVLKWEDHLSPSLLSHTCTLDSKFEHGHRSIKKVSIENSLPLISITR